MKSNQLNHYKSSEYDCHPSDPFVCHSSRPKNLRFSSQNDHRRRPLLLVWALIAHHGYHVFDTNSANLTMLALRTSQESTLLKTPSTFPRRTNSCHAHSFRPPIFFSASDQRGAHANHLHQRQPFHYTTHMSLPIHPNCLEHCLELRCHYFRLHLGFYAPQHPRFQ